MAPLVWFILFMVMPLAFPTSLLRLLSSRFPLNLMQGNSGEVRPKLFLRIVFSSLLFGGMLGLLAGCAALTAWLLSSK